ncbi:hypothetical protein [Roseobacter sp.]|uniref:hypothetical protein n=1 Tax=Roseobacter sp. TaxID=1907202 RepID=UPI0032999FB1
MGNIPADATHWDSGDWIEWHRTSAVSEQRVGFYTAPSDDPIARLHALHTRLLHSARGYLDLTGQHLPIYDEIARVHAAIALDLPATDPLLAADAPEGVQVIALPPYATNNIVHINLVRPFCCLIVVRIKTNFTSEARMVARKQLPPSSDTVLEMRWTDLPTAL